MSNETGGSRKALGRGLAALIPSSPAAGPTATEQQAASSGLRQLPIEKIKPCKQQPRKTFDADSLDELAASIRTHGVLQAILVRRIGDHYEIVAGERRWRAASRAGLQEVPALIRDLSDQETLETALIENIQREDLDPLEEAMAYKRLIDEHGLTQERLADAVGKARTTIANSLRLLNLPQPLLDKLADGQLTAGHARAIMTVGNEKDMVRLADDVVRRGLSVRDAESKARMIARSAKKALAAKASKSSPAETQVEERLMRALSTKVRLRHRNGKGRIEIFYHSNEQLDELLSRIEDDG